MKKSSTDRRTFLKRFGVLAALAPIASSFGASWLADNRLKMGLQLFTIRDFMDMDPLGSLKKVSSLGYQDLETYGYDAEKNTYYGYDAKSFKAILDDIGLTTSSGHYRIVDFLDKPMNDMKAYVDQCIAGAIELDQAYITWPFLPPESRTLEVYQRLPDILNQVGEQISSAGLGFAYHNQGYDMTDLGEGVTGYDMILKGTNPEKVKMQLDMYWAVHAGFDPVEVIARDPSRFVMWHIKDMDKVTRDYTELGNGSINYKNILSKASQKGLEFYFIEQGGNFEKDSMQSIQTSGEYFKKYLKKYM